MTRMVNKTHPIAVPTTVPIEYALSDICATIENIISIRHAMI